MAICKLGFSMNQYSRKLQLEDKFQSGMGDGFYKIVFGSLRTNSRSQTDTDDLHVRYF